MKKNELTEIYIEDLTRDGEGIGRVNGYTLFVKNAVPGDRVIARVTKAKKTYAYAIVEEMIEPSEKRADPPCAAFGKCGGCSLMHLKYSEQLAWKERLVRDSLRRIGGMASPNVREIMGMETPYGYRNKMQFPVVRKSLRDGGSAICAGFYAPHSHRVVENDGCLLGKPLYDEILGAVLEHMRRFEIEPYDEEGGTGLVRHVLIREGVSTGEIMVCPVINGHEMPHSDDFVKTISGFAGVSSICLNVNMKRGNTILGSENIVLSGKPYIEDELMGLSFRISPNSFYQVNHAQTEKLYSEVLRAAALTGSELVYDLYCGTGTISLLLARGAARVVGVEIVPEAVRDARENAERNGIGNVEFFEGAAEDLVTDAPEAGAGAFGGTAAGPQGRPDVVVLDPPRKGCAASLIETVIKLSPERVVYVSCDPATLARDVKLLSAGGYELQYAQPVDMFCQTGHVECVCLLDKNI